MKKLVYLSIIALVTTFFISCTNDSLEISNEKFTSNQVSRVGTDALGTGAKIVDLYVIAGDVNAIGTTKNGIPATNNPKVRLSPAFLTGMQFKGWKSLSRNSQNFHYGAEIELGRMKALQGKNVAILKYGVKDTKMSYWLNGVNGLNAAINAAVANLKSQGHTVRVSGVAWFQGDSDTVYPTDANAYAGRLSTVLGKVKSTANAINKANGFGNVTKYAIGLNGECGIVSLETIVKNAQKKYAAANGHSWMHLVTYDVDHVGYVALSSNNAYMYVGRDLANLL